jgi:hypothetical protein
MIYKVHDTQYMFQRHDQKLVFFALMAVFMSYCPQFWGSGWFTRSMTLSTCLRGMTKTRRFCVYGRICELLPTILGFRGDLQGPWYLVHVWEAWPKIHHFCILGPFLWTIAIVLGFQGDLQGIWQFVYSIEEWPKTHRFLRFRAVFISYCP